MPKINVTDLDPTGFLDDLKQLQDIATNLPSPTGAPGIIGAAARKACDGYSTSGLGSVPTAGSAIMDGLCKPYFDSIGATPPSSSRPYTGGQCVGVAYIIQWNAVDRFGNVSPGSRRVIGRLGQLLTQDVGTSRIYRLQTQLGQANPQEEQLASLGTGPEGEPSFTFTNVFREDGQPDSCGNLPPTFTPGTAPTYNYGDTFVHNAGGTVNNVGITVGAPTIDVDGNFSIPVTTDIGLNFDLGGSSPEVAPVANDPLNAQPAIPGSELEANDGDFPDPPEGEEYAGALFVLTSFPEGEGFLAGSIPERVFPRTVGNARLKIRSANGVESLTVNHQWREEAFSLYRPDPGLTVKGVRANVIPDFYYEVIPLTVKKTGE